MTSSWGWVFQLKTAWYKAEEELPTAELGAALPPTGK
jgi:hypothetical protein